MNNRKLYNKIMEILSIKVKQVLNENEWTDNSVEINSVIHFLKMFASNTMGLQQKLFQQKVNDAHIVEIHPLSEVFTEEEITRIKRIINPQAKACYENAWKLCDRFGYDHDIIYCEGYLDFKGIPIEHAFNKVDGKYVDITSELALHNNLKDDGYVVVGEFDTETVRKILIQTGYYGNIYEVIFMNKHKK